MSKKEIKAYMKQVHKEFKEKNKLSSKKNLKSKKLPKKERKNLELYAIKSHYGNYEVRERFALTGKDHGPKWDEVFDTKKEAIAYRNKRAKDLESQGHKVTNDQVVYYK